MRDKNKKVESKKINPALSRGVLDPAGKISLLHSSRPFEKGRGSSPWQAAGYSGKGGIKDKNSLSAALFFIFYPLSLRGGYAALTAILLIIFSSLTILGGLAFFAVQEAGVNRAYGRSVAARAVAEAGIEDGTYRILAGKQIGSSETLAVGSDLTTISVATAGNQRTIRSAGVRANVQQNIETRIEMADEAVSFLYGVQVGDGGMEMSQNSSIQGSVFSNGPITGDNGAVITGDAFAAGASRITDISVGGNAQAHQIEDSTVGGYASSTAKLDDVIVTKDAHANELRETTVNKDAYFNVIDAQSLVLGSRITPTISPSDLAPRAMPITQDMIDGWKDDAAAGGTISGNYSVVANVILGPKEITGDLLLNSNSKTLTVTGTIFVHGHIDISNGSAIRCAASYGTDSCIVLSDSWVHLQNNGIFAGSGQVGSYIMILSTLACDGTNSTPPCNVPHHHGAIDLHNNGTGAILYAAQGLIHLHNGVGISEATAYKFFLDNNAAVTYQSGLSDVHFSAGPSGGYEMEYWKQVE